MVGLKYQRTLGYTAPLCDKASGKFWNSSQNIWPTVPILILILSQICFPPIPNYSGILHMKSIHHECTTASHLIPADLILFCWYISTEVSMHYHFKVYSAITLTLMRDLIYCGQTVSIRVFI